MALKRIKDWLTTITSFRTGDVIPVDGPSGTAKMTKDNLLKETAQSNLENNFVGAFDASNHATEETRYLNGQQVSYNGRFYQFNKDHYGAWADADADVIDAKQIFSADAVSTFFDDSVKTFSRTGANGFLYIPLNFYKGLRYRIKCSVESTYATLVNKQTSGATGQTVYTSSIANKVHEFVADDNYSCLRVYMVTAGGTGSVEVSNFVLSNYVNDEILGLKQTSFNSVGVLSGLYHVSEFLKITYEKGVKYRFKNTGSNQVNVYLMKSKSTATSEIAVELATPLDIGASIDYEVSTTEFAYAMIYTLGSSPSDAGEITIEQMASNGNLNLKMNDTVEYIDGIKNIVVSNPINVETSYHTASFAAITYEKGVKYKFTNTGSQPLNLYLMKSKTTSPSEIAVTLATSLAASDYVEYEVQNIDFKYLSVYGAGDLNTGTFKVKVEQLASNANLFAKIKELAQTIASKKFSSFSIIGDSYSTYQGYIPSGYDSYYADGSGSVILTNGVFDTWWFKLATQLKIPMFRNDSWSGSTISNSVRPGLPDSSSFVKRIDSLFSSSKITDCKAGLILLFGGTNDSWLGNDHGSVKYSGWTESDLEKTLPAFCYCIDKLLRWNPGSQVVFILNNGLDATMSSGMVTACEHYDIPIVQLHDIDKSNGHPTSSGMADICSQVSEVLGGL